MLVSIRGKYPLEPDARNSVLNARVQRFTELTVNAAAARDTDEMRGIVSGQNADASNFNPELGQGRQTDQTRHQTQQGTFQHLSIIPIL